MSLDLESLAQDKIPMLPSNIVLAVMKYPIICSGTNIASQKYNVDYETNGNVQS